MNRRREAHIKHGMFGQPIYRVWGSMIQRCCNPKDEHYLFYGTRGITVCFYWRTFENFYAWALYSGYKKGLTLERTNNAGGYSPENCIWTTKVRQANNRRNNRMVEYKGESHTLADWEGLRGLRILSYGSGSLGVNGALKNH